MPAGIVKWFNPEKRFGFVTPNDGGQDIFVHISAVEAAGQRTLREGQKLEYDLVENKGRTSAVNLKLVD